VCIFETIERNLATVDFTSVLADIMVIADEVDSQLKQSISSFIAAENTRAPGGWAHSVVTESKLIIAPSTNGRAFLFWDATEEMGLAVFRFS